MMSLLKKLVTNLIIYCFCCLPIKKNKIIFFSYYGTQYGGNPKYISQYIQENYPSDRFDLVWVFNDLTSKKELMNIRKVKTMSLKYFYELCTAKVVITNYRTTELYKKRKHQFYIQTWHSSLRLKRIEKDAENALPTHYIQLAKKDSKKCDLLLSGCKYSTEIFERAFWYNGEIFEHGTPRNDLFFEKGEDKKREIYERLKISHHKKVLLYAPTFRKGNNLDVYDVNYERLSRELVTKFGGEWIVLVKLHPHLASKSAELISDRQVMDVSSHDDIQELLLVADALLTDYSSLMFDFSITNKPCFLYVADINEYKSQDRELYFELEELPFVNAQTQEMLEQAIREFDLNQYQHDLELFLRRVGSFEKGRACELLVKRIDEVCFKKTRSEVDEAV